MKNKMKIPAGKLRPRKTIATYISGLYYKVTGI